MKKLPLFRLVFLLGVMQGADADQSASISKSCTAGDIPTEHENTGNNLKKVNVKLKLYRRVLEIGAKETF